MKKTHNQGFIALFIASAISITLMTLVILSTSDVFDYVDAKKQFDALYTDIQSDIWCADEFIDILQYAPWDFIDMPTYDFTRMLYLEDTTVCHVSNIQVEVGPSNEYSHFSFTIDQYKVKGDILFGTVQKSSFMYSL